jgi:hypothetical protein
MHFLGVTATEGNANGRDGGVRDWRRQVPSGELNNSAQRGDGGEQRGRWTGEPVGRFGPTLGISQNITILP